MTAPYAVKVRPWLPLPTRKGSAFASTKFVATITRDGAFVARSGKCATASAARASAARIIAKLPA